MQTYQSVVIGSKIVSAVSVFVVLHPAWASEAQRTTDRAWVLSAKPSALFAATGGGLELGHEVTSSGVVLVNAELDHFLVGGTGFLGASWRQFVWKGTFAQGGLGVSETFFHSSSHRSPAFFGSAGWEYQGLKMFRPGIDVIGYHISFDDEALIPEMIGFPKARLTLRL